MLNEFTQDTLYDGRLVLLQPRQGYRLSVDALLLTHFATTGRRAKSCADLGSGCGVVGLSLLLARHVSRVVGIEVQARLAGLAVKNASLNHCSASYSLVQCDIRKPNAGLRDAEFDLVVSNPPFWASEKGRPPVDQERRIACHETLGTLKDWTDIAARLVHKKRGRVLFVFPSRRCVQ